MEHIVVHKAASNHVMNESGETLARTRDTKLTAQQNAERIALTWNAHDDMLEALEDAVRISDLWSPKIPIPNLNESETAEYEALFKMKKRFLSAIAKAKGETTKS